MSAPERGIRVSTAIAPVPPARPGPPTLDTVRSEVDDLRRYLRLLLQRQLDNLDRKVSRRTNEMLQSDTLAKRPAAGVADRLYFATDQPVPVRSNAYYDSGSLWVPIGEVAVTASEMVAEGRYFAATSPTPGTGVAQAISGAYAATAAFLILRNTAAAGGVTVYPDYLRLLVTQPPLNATAWHLALTIDPADRYTSGGTPLTTGNANTGYTTTGAASIIIGAPVIAAAVSPRQIARSQILATIPQIGTELLIRFGEPADSLGRTKAPADAVGLSLAAPPVALGPGGNHSLLVHAWYPTNQTVPAAFEVEIGWWER